MNAGKSAERLPWRNGCVTSGNRDQANPWPSRWKPWALFRESIKDDCEPPVTLGKGGRLCVHCVYDDDREESPVPNRMKIKKRGGPPLRCAPLGCSNSLGFYTGQALPLQGAPRASDKTTFASSEARICGVEYMRKFLLWFIWRRAPHRARSLRVGATKWIIPPGWRNKAV
jgi:hypothetical protein